MYQPCPLTGLAAAIALCMLGFGACFAAEADPEAGSDPDLTELSLEDLMNVEVTSVSKKAEPKKSAAAAIYVLTSEDIRRSGATTLPELLRTVPGVHVAKLDAHTWSVSSRGFSGQFANKLLVLIDGRSVYTPLFSGVYWESLNVPLEEIERIEVIRGPGGTLWGANAVNGVINVTTKNAKDSQGGLVTFGGGTEERGFGTVRYGGTIGGNGHFRIYGGYTNRDEGDAAAGAPAEDDWDGGFSGVRLDFTPNEVDRFSVIGEFYGDRTTYGSSKPLRVIPVDVDERAFADYANASITALWERDLGDGSSLQLQSYYDYFEVNSTPLQQSQHTMDLDFQHRFRPGERQEIVWGLGFRYVEDEIDGTAALSLDPSERRYRTFSGFVQDSVALIPDTLDLTLGVKIEHNDFTGVEVQPNARLVWSVNDRHTLWAAVSRAVRSPSRVESDARVENATYRRVVASLYGDEDYESEDLTAFELGHRVSLGNTAALDTTVFYNRYADLRTVELRQPFLEFDPLPVHIAVPFATDNNMDGCSYGIEFVLDWRPKPWWHIRTGYSYLEMDLTLSPRTVDILSGSTDDETPEQMAFMQHRLDVSRNVEFDVTLRYVDSIPALAVDDYATMDLRLAWRPRDDLELSIIGQNLFDDSQPEYNPSFIDLSPTEVERGVYGKVTWRF